MLTWLVNKAFASVVRTGRLTVVLPGGEALAFGDGSGQPVRIRFTDRGSIIGVLTNPDLRLGEAFTDGRMIMEQGTVYDLLCLIMSQPSEPRKPLERFIERSRRAWSLWRQQNLPGQSRRNVAHHYDLGDDFYALFLDPDWQYSCAYFESDDQSLADAQLAKKRHIAAKLLVRPGDRVLDIGCGWGGLGLYLAEVADAASVVGVTLSEEQLARARSRASRSPRGDRLDFRIQDYRAVPETFDRIVSVGMFEHVGLNFYDTFFATCRERLTEDGVMLLHTIGSSDEPTVTNPWMTRYIFPGGHLPSLSDLAPAIERSGLVVTDVEVLRLHYAKTLRAWHDAFDARRAEAEAMFDARFCRMWEFYLSLSEAAFRHEDIVIFQLQLARRQENVPVTRDYLPLAEAALRQAEAGTARKDAA